MNNFYNRLGKNAYLNGLSAETLAANYLIKHHWHILHRRYRCPFGEIDLIAQQEKIIIFVEVKKRKQLQDALLALSVQQKDRLTKSALYYLDMFNLDNIEAIRFDFMAVNQQNQIKHVKNITLY